MLICQAAVITYALIVAPPANASTGARACFDTQQQCELVRDEWNLAFRESDTMMVAYCAPQPVDLGQRYNPYPKVTPPPMPGRPA